MPFAQHLRRRIAQAWQGFTAPSPQGPHTPAAAPEPGPAATPDAAQIGRAVLLARAALQQLRSASQDLDNPAKPVPARSVARALREHAVHLETALAALDAELRAQAAPPDMAATPSASHRLATAVIRSAAVPRTPSTDDRHIEKRS